MAADALARSDGGSISSSSAPCAPRYGECSVFLGPVFFVGKKRNTQSTTMRPEGVHMFSFIGILQVSSQSSPSHLFPMISCRPLERLGDPNLPRPWGRHGSVGAIHNARRAPPNPPVGAAASIDESRSRCTLWHHGH